MKLRPEALAQHLKQRLAPLYLISGDEPLLLQEAADQVRGAARAAGYDERVALHADSHFKWGELSAVGHLRSLFADKQLIELRLPTGKPGREGGQALQAWANKPPTDRLLLILSAKLDAAAQKTQWFKALDRVGATLPLWPIERSRLPQWVAMRMRAAGLQATPEAAAVLAERSEGNLLAAVQEIEKLALTTPPGLRLDGAATLAAVADNARYDVFLLADAALGGDAARALRILEGLRAEETAPQVVLWALARDLRDLAVMATRCASGGAPPAAVVARHQAVEPAHPAIWKRRSPLFVNALRRLDATRCDALLRHAARADRVGKGQEEGEAWLELTELTLGLCGRPALRAG